MPEWPRFGNAPISEAILDIRVTLPPYVEVQRLASFQNPIRARYPLSRRRTALPTDVGLREGGVQVVPSTTVSDGYLFSTEDRLQTVQVRMDGFTFNRLKPYDRWTTFRDEARALWALYREVARPERVTRLALRYINRIAIPLPITDFSEWVRTTPEIAPGLPQNLQSFFMRLEIPYEPIGGLAIVTETIERPEGNRLPFLLDINVITRGDLSTDDPYVWDAFDRLRDFKNEIFFKSVTDRAKELFA